MENLAPKQVRFGEWISEGWRMFTTQWKGWVMLSLGMFGAVAVPVTVYIIFVYVTLIATTAVQTGSRGSSDAETVGVFLILASFFLLMLVMLPLSALLAAGMHKAALKQLRGGQVEFKDLFSARDRVVPILGAILLIGLLSGLGTIVCIIPAFIVAGLFFFTLPLIVDRKLGVIEAMKASAEMTKPNLLMFTVFAVVVQLISSAGTLACYVGLLATLPLVFTMTAAAYRDCFGVEGAALLPPAEPWSGASYSPPAPRTTAPPPNPPAEPWPGASYSPPSPGPAPPRTAAPELSAPRPTPPSPTPPSQTPPGPTPPGPAPGGTIALGTPASPSGVCAKCGASLPASARFCFRCGEPAPGK